MLEDELIAEIGKLCNQRGLWWAHFNVVYRGRRDLIGSYGFPDLVIAGRSGVLFRECKAAGGTLRPDQQNWRDALRYSGQDWALWRPEDLRDGIIERELDSIMTA